MLTVTFRVQSRIFNNASPQIYIGVMCRCRYHDHTYYEVLITEVQMRRANYNSCATVLVLPLPYPREEIVNGLLFNCIQSDRGQGIATSLQHSYAFWRIGNFQSWVLNDARWFTELSSFPCLVKKPSDKISCRKPPWHGDVPILRRWSFHPLIVICMVNSEHKLNPSNLLKLAILSRKDNSTSYIRDIYFYWASTCSYFRDFMQFGKVFSEPHTFSIKM